MTAATDLSTADVLRAAKQVLIERGWTRGQMESPDGCVCAEQAIDIAWGEDMSPIDEYLAVFRALRRGYGQRGVPVYRFNDRQTSVEPVLAAFDKAIALAEAEASR